jgi:predicted RNA-binding Zn-ribbon protein involved in translation (DUF1610 family)
VKYRNRLLLAHKRWWKHRPWRMRSTMSQIHCSTCGRQTIWESKCVWSVPHVGSNWAWYCRRCGNA